MKNLLALRLPGPAAPCSGDLRGYRTTEREPAKERARVCAFVSVCPHVPLAALLNCLSTTATLLGEQQHETKE